MAVSHPRVRGLIVAVEVLPDLGKTSKSHPHTRGLIVTEFLPKSGKNISPTHAGIEGYEKTKSKLEVDRAGNRSGIIEGETVNLETRIGKLEQAQSVEVCSQCKQYPGAQVDVEAAVKDALADPHVVSCKPILSACSKCGAQRLILLQGVDYSRV
jgi:hypothetical protein